MKKTHLMALAIGACAMIPATTWAGSPGSFTTLDASGNTTLNGTTTAVNGQFRVTGGGRNVIVAGQSKKYEFKANDNNKVVVAITNSSNTSVIQNNVNASGGGELRVTNSSGTTNILLNGDTKAYVRNINFGIGTNSPTSPLHVIGAAKIAGTATVNVLEITGGSDLAEQFVASNGAKLEAGTVVSIDPANAGALKLSGSAYDRTVAGIVSGANGLNTGMTMGQEGHEITGGVNVALTGRVFVKADATGGAITPGSLLTTSAIPGHAMAVADHGKAQGAIIGKAMTGLDAGTGMVLVLVSLQ